MLSSKNLDFAQARKKKLKAEIENKKLKVK